MCFCVMGNKPCELGLCGVLQCAHTKMRRRRPPNDAAANAHFFALMLDAFRLARVEPARPGVVSHIQPTSGMASSSLPLPPACTEAKTEWRPPVRPPPRGRHKPLRSSAGREARKPCLQICCIRSFTLWRSRRLWRSSNASEVGSRC